LNLQDQKKYSALILSAIRGHTEITKLLIDAGADLNLQDQCKYSALIWSASRGHTEIAKLLKDAGAD
jgi:ankyrin repeat protein